MNWSGLGKTAYFTAFDELVDKGYLIQDKEQKNKYNFYDKSHKEEESQQIDNVIIDYTNAGFVF